MIRVGNYKAGDAQGQDISETRERGETTKIKQTGNKENNM